MDIVYKASDPLDEFYRICDEQGEERRLEARRMLLRSEVYNDKISVSSKHESYGKFMALGIKGLFDNGHCCPAIHCHTGRTALYSADRSDSMLWFFNDSARRHDNS